MRAEKREDEDGLSGFSVFLSGPAPEIRSGERDSKEARLEGGPPPQQGVALGEEAAVDRVLERAEAAAVSEKRR